ncbi:MAG: hypothetical protein ACYDFT_07890 [Thermoplasmata archaeon]
MNLIAASGTNVSGVFTTNTGVEIALMAPSDGPGFIVRPSIFACRNSTECSTTGSPTSGHVQWHPETYWPGCTISSVGCAWPDFPHDMDSSFMASITWSRSLAANYSSIGG